MGINLEVEEEDPLFPLPDDEGPFDGGEVDATMESLPSHPSENSRRKKKIWMNPDAPKPPRSAYYFFVMDNQNEVQAVSEAHMRVSQRI